MATKKLNTNREEQMTAKEKSKPRDPGDSKGRAEDILKLIRSRQKPLPTIEETLTTAQNKRLRPLAWLIQNQKYTAQEILIVTCINEQRLQYLEDNAKEFDRQRGNK